jgi:hypothetical protein
MKRKNSNSNTSDDNKKTQLNSKNAQTNLTVEKIVCAPTEEHTIESLGKVTGLSTFMLLVISDLYDTKTKKFNKPEVITDVTFPNSNIRAFNKDEIEKYRQKNTKKEKSFTIDSCIKLALEEREKQLRENRVLIGGTTDQFVDIPKREKDTIMMNEFLGHVKTKNGYFMYVYYTGPEDRGKDNIEQSKQENWRIVHKSHLRYFHTRITKPIDFYKHTKNDQVGTRDEKYPSYDPRFIVYKWMKAPINKEHLKLIIKNISLLQDNDDFLITTLKKRKKEKDELQQVKKQEDEGEEELVIVSSPKKMIDLTIAVDSTTVHDDDDDAKFDPIFDREEQAKKGFVITPSGDDEDLCRIYMDEYPNVFRFPLPNDMTFNMNDLIYIAKRVDPGTTIKEWDPSILAKALIISHHPNRFMKTSLSTILDRHLHILERDNTQPILDYIKNNPDCVNRLKESTSQIIYALFAAEISSRQIPDEFNALLPNSDDDDDDDDDDEMKIVDENK